MKKTFILDTNVLLHVNAAPYGIPIYTRLGFLPTDTQQNVNGVIFTPMKYEE